MPNSSLPDELTLMSRSTNTPPPPFQPAPPAPPQSLAYPPQPAYPLRPAGTQPPKQHPTVSVQMSPRNLILGGSVLAFVIVVIAAIALMSGGSRTTPNIYSNGAFPGGPNTGNSSTTTDANGNSVTMGPGAHTVQNADGSTTTTDANGNTVTQGGSGSGESAPPAPQQSPFQGDSSFPQQQQQGGFPDQQQGYPQQQGPYNPQQTYPR